MPSSPSSSASSTTVAETGPEIQPIADLKPSQWAGTLIPARIDKEKIADYNYAGEGTAAAPFLVEFLPNDVIFVHAKKSRLGRHCIVSAHLCE